MIFKKQLVANKQNARRVVSKLRRVRLAAWLNAVKHGFLLEEILPIGENEEALTGPKERLVAPRLILLPKG